MKIKKQDTCCIFNIAPHYRAPIYELLDQDLNCDFYLGDKIHASLEKMDYARLMGFRKVLVYQKIFKDFYWQGGAVKNVFKPYNTFGFLDHET